MKPKINYTNIKKLDKNTKIVMKKKSKLSERCKNTWSENWNFVDHSKPIARKYSTETTICKLLKKKKKKAKKQTNIIRKHIIKYV